MIKNNIPLVNAIIDAFLFLETSDRSEVDPDSAVRCMENMSSSILDLDLSDQLELRRQLQKISGDSQDIAFKDFVQNLPDLIGLATS